MIVKITVSGFCVDGDDEMTSDLIKNIWFHQQIKTLDNKWSAMIPQWERDSWKILELQGTLCENNVTAIARLAWPKKNCEVTIHGSHSVFYLVVQARLEPYYFLNNHAFVSNNSLPEDAMDFKL